MSERECGMCMHEYHLHVNREGSSSSGIRVSNVLYPRPCTLSGRMLAVSVQPFRISSSH